MQYLINRLKEPSTWAGVGGAITAGSQAIATKDPQMIAAAVFSLLAAFMRDNKPKI